MGNLTAITGISIGKSKLNPFQSASNVNVTFKKSKPFVNPHTFIYSTINSITQVIAKINVFYWEGFGDIPVETSISPLFCKPQLSLDKVMMGVKCQVCTDI